MRNTLTAMGVPHKGLLLPRINARYRFGPLVPKWCSTRVEAGIAADVDSCKQWIRNPERDRAIAKI